MASLSALDGGVFVFVFLCVFVFVFVFVFVHASVASLLASKRGGSLKSESY